MQVVCKLDDLTADERAVYHAMTKEGFLYPKDVAHRARLELTPARQALKTLYQQGFILHNRGKVSLNVLAKQVLGFYDE